MRSVDEREKALQDSPRAHDRHSRPQLTVADFHKQSLVRRERATTVRELSQRRELRPGGQSDREQRVANELTRFRVRTQICHRAVEERHRERVWSKVPVM